MIQLFRQIRHAFANNLPERRQVIAWLVSVVVMAGIAIFSHRTQINDQGFFVYVLGLYVLNSLVFFALFAERPKLKLVMLTSIFLIEVAAVGYFVLKFASPR